MMHRNDGAFTSGDIGLKFNKVILLDEEHMKKIIKLEGDERWVFANLVALCGFEMSSEKTENNLFSMCEYVKNI